MKIANQEFCKLLSLFFSHLSSTILPPKKKEAHSTNAIDFLLERYNVYSAKYPTVDCGIFDLGVFTRVRYV